MWTISEVKNRGAFFLKKNYWKTVLVSYIISKFFGGGANPSSFLNLSLNLGDLNSQSSDTQSGFSAQLEEFFANYAELFSAFTAIFAGVTFIISVLALLMKIFVLSPIQVGTCSYMYESLYQPGRIVNVFNGFKNNYGNNVKTMFLKDIYLTLWTMLFIIPGIIKSYEYRLVPYILNECPNMSSNEVIRLSSQLMKGHKMHTFWLDVSFIGWQIVTLISCGFAGIFFVNPYIQMTNAAHYDKMKFLYNEKHKAS